MFNKNEYMRKLRDDLKKELEQEIRDFLNPSSNKEDGVIITNTIEGSVALARYNDKVEAYKGSSGRLNGDQLIIDGIPVTENDPRRIANPHSLFSSTQETQSDDKDSSVQYRP